MNKPNILAIIRPLPPYLKLLESLQAKYNLIVPLNIAEILQKNDIPHEIFENLVDSEKVYYWVDKTMAKLPKDLSMVFQKKTFHEQFAFENHNFFDEIREPFFQNLLTQFHEEIFLIESFRQLQSRRKLSLVVLWTDVIRYTKTLTFAAKQHKTPTLQLLHGGLGCYMIGHYENDIYTDKIANVSHYSKDFYGFYGRDPDKVVQTGRIEFDFDQAMPAMSHEEACGILGLDSKRPIVVLGTTWISATGVGFDKYLESVGLVYKKFMEAFAKLRKTRPDFQLVIKLHPEIRDHNNPAYFTRIAVDCGIKDALVTVDRLPECLQVCDLLVSFKSTICVEAILRDKAVVILDICDAGGDHLFFKDQAFEYIRNIEDIYPTLEKALCDDKFRAKLEKKRETSKNYFNYFNDGKAMDRIIDLISDMTSENFKG